MNRAEAAGNGAGNGGLPGTPPGVEAK